MASLDILCSNPLNLKSKITKIEHKKIFCAPSKILKNISWPINICLKYFMTPTKSLRPPSYILIVRSLIKKQVKVYHNGCSKLYQECPRNVTPYWVWFLVLNNWFSNPLLPTHIFQVFIEWTWLFTGKLISIY